MADHVTVYTCNTCGVAQEVDDETQYEHECAVCGGCVPVDVTNRVE